MSKRKCKPADQWIQLPLFADSARETESVAFVEDLKQVSFREN